jgi:hypothetical protein
MIRTTDAMIKSVNVQKAKERLQGNKDALAKATAAGSQEFIAIFNDWVATSEREVAEAMALLRNPAA